MVITIFLQLNQRYYLTTIMLTPMSFVRSYTLRQLSPLFSGEVFVLLFSQFLEKYRAGQTARVRRPCAIECRPPSAICYCRLRVTIVFPDSGR